ncbi:hypothetical protein IFM89_038484 [Coptis chinensis]|uniref:SBP-type domain-containing protein n=1 Tax=Coptis chinensis TaxID=261450 RepID=A0A835MBM8_9MAGN|nr:hypothetical protein IFM89_038484 [Coptis chinensis]
MEAWNYGSEEKGFVLSDEMVSNGDAVARSRTVVMGWDLMRSPFNYENTRLDSGGDVEVNQGFMDLGFSDMTRKQFPAAGNYFGEYLDSKMSSGIVSSPSNSKEFSQEDSSSRFSTSVVDSNSRDSSLFDLKLGRLGDNQDTQVGNSSKEMPSPSSVSSSVPEKRARTTGLTFQRAICQVHGCSKDLSSSKDYHKRHKVCEVHSKTAKVIVNGIEQRFCQQCSRFHLLPEFDDGKRSCRKRLAGHNERRRKPHLDSHSGSRFLGTSPMRMSFINPSTFPNGIMQPVKYETSNWSRGVKLENEDYNPVMNEHLRPKSFPLCGVEKQFPFLHGNHIETARSSSLCENNTRYQHTLLVPDSLSQLALRSAPSGSEDITAYDTASTLHRVSGASEASSALSLLSSQSHISPHSSAIPMGQPLLIQGNHPNYNLNQFSQKVFGISSQASTSLGSNRFSSSVEIERLNPIVASDASNSVNFGVHTDGIFHATDLVSATDLLSHEHTDATTVDLLQLSSELQRVEHQRHSMQAKQENDTFFYLPIT